jgi:bifunctional non-homologous end joining protein LigD
MLPMPRHYTPMLATTVKRPFNNPDWQGEVKWDGYRMLAYVDK